MPIETARISIRIQVIAKTMEPSAFHHARLLGNRSGLNRPKEIAEMKYAAAASATKITMS